MSIAVLLSTRQRPESLRVAVQSLSETAVLPDTNILVGFDPDENPDEKSPLNLSAFNTVIDPRPDSLGGKYNALWRAMPGYDYYVYAVDDIAYKTVGWDAKITEVGKLFMDGIGMVSAAPYLGIPMIRAMSRRLVETIGYFCPEFFPFGADDAWQQEIAMFAQRMVGIPDIEIELIGGRGKTRGLHEADFWGRYFDALLPERERLANKVLDACDESPTRRALIRDIFPLMKDVFLRRGGLRDPQKALEYEKLYAFDNEPDDRYMRLKKKALDFMGE